MPFDQKSSLSTRQSHHQAIRTSISTIEAFQTEPFLSSQQFNFKDSLTLSKQQLWRRALWLEDLLPLTNPAGIVGDGVALPVGGVVWA